eukprot:superscaffoldBa00000706_g6687
MQDSVGSADTVAVEMVTTHLNVCPGHINCCPMMSGFHFKLSLQPSSDDIDLEVEIHLHPSVSWVLRAHVLTCAMASTHGVRCCFCFMLSVGCRAHTAVTALTKKVSQQHERMGIQHSKQDRKEVTANTEKPATRDDGQPTQQTGQKRSDSEYRETSNTRGRAADTVNRTAK